VARFKSLADDDVTGRTRANAAARMIQGDTSAVRDVENTAAEPTPAVGQLLRIDLENFAFRQECDAVFLLGRIEISRSDVRVDPTHIAFLMRRRNPRRAADESPQLSDRGLSPRLAG